MRVVTAAAFLAGAAVALGGAVGATWLTAKAPEPPPAMTAAEVRDIVEAHLAEKPEVVIDAIRGFQAREEKREADARSQTLASMWDRIARADGDPILGNPDGDVTLVEFFDYRCGYCKRVLPDMMALVAEDPKLRIVMKEFPILGPESVLAARVALAADRQDRYAELHEALMAASGRLDTDRIFQIAEEAGLDMERLRQDMQSPAVDAILRENMELAEELGVRGTPAFLTRGEVTPGAVSGSVLREMVAKARRDAS